MSKSLVIADTVISQDAEGRFSLNDLHRAAGGQRKHGPSLWMENQQTKDLVAEIAQELSDTGNPVSVVKGGLNQGTYVAMELVYAYAMWISPVFHLKVIRAYNALATTAAALGVSVEDIVAQVLKTAIPAVMAGAVDLVKSITLQENEAFKAKLESDFASGHIGVVHGVTVGDVLDEFKIAGIRGLSVRLSRILCEGGCQLDGCVRTRMGKRRAKMFHPDKAAKMMREWAADDCRKYIQERKGQKTLNLVAVRTQ